LFVITPFASIVIAPSLVSVPLFISVMSPERVRVRLPPTVSVPLSAMVTVRLVPALLERTSALLSLKLVQKEEMFDIYSSSKIGVG
jgi:hypothetical protein